MKALFRARQDEAELPHFTVLIEQAVELHRELSKPGRFSDIRAQRMTKQAAISEALANARCDMARIEQVRKAID